MCNPMFSWHIISLNEFGGVKNIFFFPENLNSCCLEQVDIPESINVMNVILPVVFWNMIVFGGDSVMVWAGIHHDGPTDLVKVTGTRDQCPNMPG